mmetsp:Transcript_35933/g.89421  ORF Transcript_35933/g.89421 Transcript_35933/m.89421 type:complete len:240 (+) Transcript_35933:2568-3287(+)
MRSGFPSARRSTTSPLSFTVHESRITCRGTNLRACSTSSTLAVPPRLSGSEGRGIPTRCATPESMTRLACALNCCFLSSWLPMSAARMRSTGQGVRSASSASRPGRFVMMMWPRWHHAKLSSSGSSVCRMSVADLDEPTMNLRSPASNSALRSVMSAACITVAPLVTSAGLNGHSGGPESVSFAPVAKTSARHRTRNPSHSARSLAGSSSSRRCERYLALSRTSTRSCTTIASMYSRSS